MVEEIDLTHYVVLLLRKWWLILLAVALCVVAAMTVVSMRPHAYEARVLVATVRERIDISFSDEIRTLTEYDLRPYVDERRRMETFVKMVPNPMIAQEVIEQLGERLPETYRNANTLSAMVSGTIADNSDAIEITVHSKNPDALVVLANAWAEVYVRTVNKTYGSLDQVTSEAVSTQVQEAQATYADEQKALEQVLQTSQVDHLQRQLVYYQAMLDSLVQDESLALQRTLADRQRVLWLLRSARDMRTQAMQSGGTCPTCDVQALTLLQIQVYGLDIPDFAEWGAFVPSRTGTLSTGESYASGSLMIPDGTSVGAGAVQLHIHTGESDSVGQMSREDLLASVDSLVQVLEQRSTMVGQGVAAQLAQSAQGNPETVAADRDRLEQAVRDTRMLLSQASTALTDATMRRDVAQDTYEALARKEAELAVSAETTGAQVRLAVLASRAQSLQPSRTRALGMAVLAGLALGVMAVLLLDLWQRHLRHRFQAPAIQA